MSLWLSETLRHLLLQVNLCHQISSFVARVYPYLSRSTSSQCQPDSIFWILILPSREMSANMVSSSQRQWCVCVYTQSCPTLWDPMDYSPQAPRPMGFSRQEHWHGLPFPPPGDLPNPGIKRMSPVSPVLAGGFFTIQPPGKAMLPHHLCHFHQALSVCCPKFWTDVCFPGPNRVGHLLSFLMIYSSFFFFAMPLVACKTSLTSDRTCAPSIRMEECHWNTWEVWHFLDIKVPFYMSSLRQWQSVLYVAFVVQ